LLPKQHVLGGKNCSAAEKRLEKRHNQMDNTHRFASVNQLRGEILQQRPPAGKQRKSCRINADGIFWSHSERMGIKHWVAAMPL